MAVPNLFLGNLTASILDHLSQFLVAPNIFFDVSYPNSSNYERTGQDLIKRILYFLVNWFYQLTFAFI